MSTEKNIYKNRLLLLASFLETLPEERFDYNHWVGKDWGGKSDLSCQTTACALGWATTIPELADAGLMLIPSPNSVRHGGVVSLRQEREFIEKELGLFFAPNRAGEVVFDLDDYEFDFLFIPDGGSMFERKALKSSATAKEVAAHIRFFVENKYQ